MALNSTKFNRMLIDCWKKENSVMKEGTVLTKALYMMMALYFGNQGSEFGDELIS